MYEHESPLPLGEVARVVVGVRQALFEAYWHHGNVPGPNSDGGSGVAFGLFVIDAATRLLRDLYGRCSRRPFCNVTNW